MRRILIIVGIVLIPVIPIVLVVTGVIQKKPTQVTRVNLTVWTTANEQAAFAPLIKAFRDTHSYVSIKVQKIQEEDYANRLVQAWAQGNGPDIFFVPSTWIGAMQSYASAMPADVTIPIIETKKGVFGTQTTVSRPTVKAPTLASLRESYVDVVPSDIIRSNQIWALPLAIDTVVTYVNKDLLNNAKIFTPAATWTDLVNQVVQNKLTVVDESGGVVQSGVALGTTGNLPYATDLLSLLMMQNGDVMIDPTTKQVRFSDAAGLDALNFFTSFSSPKKTAYSWNSEQPNARDAFLKGRVAYYFGTYADRAAIAASGINWTVSPMLHLDARGDKDGLSGGQRFIDLARYSVGMVSKSAVTGRRATTAWNFLRYLATNTSALNSYLKSTDQLSAIKSVLTTQKNDTNKTVFANQMLTARSWYRGKDAVRATGYLTQLITAVIKDGETPKTALDLAARQVDTTL